jgi:hypothetical protein
LASVLTFLPVARALFHQPHDRVGALRHHYCVIDPSPDELSL